ncbi:ABC transporter permease [Candidatus Woesearchaeota archaeon]|nr:ABC transporter permease [Candidatus Woesearchaeota archaeon]
MRALFLLTLKNLKLLVRAKASALIVVFAPLLIILILGLSYNTSAQYGLNIGVYSTSFTADVESFITTLQHEEFKIVKYDSIDKCIGDIKLGFIHTCINVPESLAIDANVQKEIVFHLDPSKINLVYMIQETLKNKFNLKAQQLSQELTQNILTQLSTAKSTIGDKKSLLQTAKDKNTAVSSQADTIIASISSLDLGVAETTYDLAVISDTGTKVSAALDKVKEAKTAFEGLNVSAGDTAVLTAALDEAESKLKSANNFINGTDAGTIRSLVMSLEAELSGLKGKLTSASTALGTASTDLGTAKGSLSEGVTALDDLLNALNALQTSLESLKVTDASTISAPLVTKIEKVGPEGTYLNYMFPALLVLVVMFTSLLLGTTLVMMEKNSPAFLRNYFLPLKKVTFIMATYLTTVILMIIQIGIILGVSLFFLKDSASSLPYLILILLLASSVFTFLGMALGYLFTSEETGVLASISMGSIMLFLSGVILPLESVSPLLRNITYYNPFVLAEKLIREVFIFQTAWSGLWVDLLTLFGYAVALFLVILIAETLLHKHLVHRFLKHHHRLPKKIIKTKTFPTITSMKNIRLIYNTHVMKNLKLKKNKQFNQHEPLNKHKLIILTGTPGTGKSTLALRLSKLLKIPRFDLHKHYREVSSTFDKKKDCYVIDIKKLEKVLIEKLNKGEKGYILDTHLSHLLPAKLVSVCIVLTCSNLKELERRLKRRRYSLTKIRENLDSEIFQVCLQEAQERGHKVLVLDSCKRINLRELVKEIQKAHYIKIKTKFC